MGVDGLTVLYHWLMALSTTTSTAHQLSTLFTIQTQRDGPLALFSELGRLLQLAGRCRQPDSRLFVVLLQQTNTTRHGANVILSLQTDFCFDESLAKKLSAITEFRLVTGSSGVPWSADVDGNWFCTWCFVSLAPIHKHYSMPINLHIAYS